MKRLNGVLQASVIIILVFSISVSSVISSHADVLFVFNQNVFTYVPYGKYGTLASGGCGAVSFMNAVYYLSGKKLDPMFTADYSVSVGARVYGSGTIGWLLAKRFCEDYGAQYKIEYLGLDNSMSNVCAFVSQSGQVVMCGILSGSAQGHFIILAEYDSASDSFMILDSNPRDVRNTYPNGYGWVSRSFLVNTVCASNYIYMRSVAEAAAPTTVPTTVPTTLPPPPPPMAVDNSGHYIYDFVEGLSVGELSKLLLACDDFGSSVMYSDLYRGTAYIGDMKEKIITGMTAEITLADTGKVVYTLIIDGDTDCDGEIKPSDARLALRAAADMEKLTAVSFAAADVERDAAVKSDDARLILRAAAGIEKIGNY